MREAKLSELVQASLVHQFKEACYLNKNHGNEFQSKGRPDIEGSIFGRHFGFELKAGSRFSPHQILHLNRIAKSGGIGGGIIFAKGCFYFLTSSQAANYSLRNLDKYYQIPHNRYLDFTFLYKYLNLFYLYYHGEIDVLPEAG
jgi:penicillin-binding protein-related factor A (putative recombinase)